MANDRVAGPGKAQVVVQPCRKRSRRDLSGLKTIKAGFGDAENAPGSPRHGSVAPKNAGSGRADKAPVVVRQ